MKLITLHVPHINIQPRPLNMRKKPRRLKSIIVHNDLSQFCTRKHPVTGKAKRKKGIIAIINRCTAGIDGKIDLQLLYSSTASDALSMSRFLGGDVVRISRENGIYPSHLPDLSNLALAPRALKVFVKWAFEKKRLEKSCIKNNNLLPESVSNIIDPPALIPTVKGLIHLQPGHNNIVINSYGNDFKLMRTTQGSSLSSIALQTTQHITHLLHGRRLSVRMNIVNNFCSRGERYMLWNCKDMGRHDFIRKISEQIEVHMPDMVLLTETRVSVDIARLISVPLKPLQVNGLSQSHTVGGYILLIFSPLLAIKLSTTDDSTQQWVLR